jgi:hypothetical protein
MAPTDAFDRFVMAITLGATLGAPQPTPCVPTRALRHHASDHPA